MMNHISLFVYQVRALKALDYGYIFNDISRPEQHIMNTQAALTDFIKIIENMATIKSTSNRNQPDVIS